MKKQNLKKIIIGLLLCSCIILCSCANNTEQFIQNTEDTSSSAEELSGEEVSEEENLVNIRYDMIHIDETLLVDNEDFSYKITGVDPYRNDNTEYAIVAEEILKTDEPQTKISFDRIIVNGVECNFGQSWDSASPARWITLNYIELSKMGITDITDITIVYSISKKDGDNSWSYNTVEVKEQHVYPYGEEYAERYIHQQSEDETIILDNEYVKIYAKDFFSSTYYNIIMENKTNDVLSVDIYTKKINVYDVNGYDGNSGCKSNRIYPNTYTFIYFIPSVNTIFENDITQIDNIEFEIIIDNNFSSPETITLNTDISLNVMENPVANETIETTNFEDYYALREYTETLGQSVGAIYDFSPNGTNTQTILYNSAHYELELSSLGYYHLSILTPKTAIALYETSDIVNVTSPGVDDVFLSYYLTIDTDDIDDTELELPIMIMHDNGTIEKMTLYLTLK